MSLPSPDHKNRVRAGLLVACALGVTLAVSGACNPQQFAITENVFRAPQALAVASATDRDLLFISSSGGSELHALTMCTSLDSDGGVGGSCTPQEDFFLLPSPVRVFSGGVPTVDRPSRMTGVRLSNGAIRSGAVVVSGSTSEVRIIDANSVLASSQKTGSVRQIPLDLGGVPVDVTSRDCTLDPLRTVPGGGSVGCGSQSKAQVYAATQGNATTPPQLLALEVGLDASGSIGGRILARCVLPTDAANGLVPTRLALVPAVQPSDLTKPSNTARQDSLYVADGAAGGTAGGRGDGLVEFSIAQLLATAPGAACPAGQRISAGGHPLRSIAVNPPTVAVKGDPRALDAGQEIVGLTVSGEVFFLSTATRKVAPVPPFAVDDASPAAAARPMEGLVLPGAGREVTFLSPPNKGICKFDVPLDVITPISQPQDDCYVTVNVLPSQLNSASQLARMRLVAAVSTSTGNVVMIDALARRTLNSLADATIGYDRNQLKPKVGTLRGPSGTNLTINFPGEVGTAGVTQNQQWLVSYHGDIPGLERVGGTLQPGSGGSLEFRTPPTSQPFSRWQAAQAPELALAKGDLVVFGTFSPVPGGQPLCDALQNYNASQNRTEQVISADPTEHGLTVAATGLPAADSGCYPVGVSTEVRTGGDTPWLVASYPLTQLGSNPIVRGRAATSTPGASRPFTALNRRFDYPLDYQLPGGPPVANVELVFTIDPVNPALPVTIGSSAVFSFTMTGVQGLVSFGDNNGGSLSLPEASDVLAYTSPTRKTTNLVFSAITGGNSVLILDPALAYLALRGVSTLR